VFVTNLNINQTPFILLTFVPDNASALAEGKLQHSNINEHRQINVQFFSSDGFDFSALTCVENPPVVDG
jgi:hypothetical protein